MKNYIKISLIICGLQLGYFEYSVCKVFSVSLSDAKDAINEKIASLGAGAFTPMDTAEPNGKLTKLINTVNSVVSKISVAGLDEKNKYKIAMNDLLHPTNEIGMGVGDTLEVTD